MDNLKKETEKKYKVLDVLRQKGVFNKDNKEIEYDNSILIVATVIDSDITYVDTKSYKVKTADFQKVCGFDKSAIRGKFIKGSYFDVFGRLNKIEYLI